MYMRQKPAHIQLMSAGYAHLFGVLFHIKYTKKGYNYVFSKCLKQNKSATHYVLVRNTVNVDI